MTEYVHACSSGAKVREVTTGFCLNLRPTLQEESDMWRYKSGQGQISWKSIGPRNGSIAFILLNGLYMSNCALTCVSYTRRLAQDPNLFRKVSSCCVLLDGGLHRRSQLVRVQSVPVARSGTSVLPSLQRLGDLGQEHSYSGCLVK